MDRTYSHTLQSILSVLSGEGEKCLLLRLESSLRSEFTVG